MQKFYFVFALFISLFSHQSLGVEEKRQPIKALYMPLADHYAAVIAYELYRDELVYADFSLEQMNSWDLMRVNFLNQRADMAFVMAPLAMSMYQNQKSFKWVGLMHRDGSGLAITNQLASHLSLPEQANARLPTSALAKAIDNAQKTQNRVVVGVPHIVSTHSVVLYKYLKDNHLTLGISPNDKADVYVRTISPPSSPAFLLGRSNMSHIAAIEQSLTWIETAESKNFGKVAWYSKEVVQSDKGHVECIALASNEALAHKEQAVAEVFDAIKRAGTYIEDARRQGGDSLANVVRIITKHMPSHSPEVVIRSLESTMRIINYENLDIDIVGLTQIMELAVESSVLKKAIDIESFTHQFAYQQTTNQSKVTYEIK